MKIYHYSPTSGVFMGDGIADEDPLDKGNFLIPAYATKAAPPAQQASKIRVFRDGKWSLVESLAPPPPEDVEDPTIEDVANERTRRLALGFEYDFRDDRGIHRIGTTLADMAGWDRVTQMKDALYQAGDTTTKITISTDTGIVRVTGPEWNALLLHGATYHEQPLWQASFALMAMDPIPADYATNPAHWPKLK